MIDETFTIHRLKCWQRYWLDIAKGQKTFELRRVGERNYAVGNVLILHAVSGAEPHLPVGNCAPLYAEVSYLLYGKEAEAFGLKPDHCILGLIFDTTRTNLVKTLEEGGVRQLIIPE